MTTDPHAALAEEIAKPIEQELCSRWLDTDDFAEEWVDPGRPVHHMYCEEHDSMTRPGDRCPEALKIARALLPLVLREKAGAWDEATRIALDFAYLNDDGITLYLRPPNNRNPYREEEATDGR